MSGNATKQKLFTKNFTYLIIGQLFSLVGNYTLKFALSMYVLEKTGSAAVFAGLLSVAIIPTILLSPFGGILADRANRKNIMVGLDFLSGVSVLLAALLFTTVDSIALIGSLMVALSILGAFESPTIQACVPQMQTGENILKGNAVVNQVAAVAALVTPFLGSIVYTAFGIGPVLYATMTCFFLTALLECFIRLDHKKSSDRKSIFCIVKGDLYSSMRFLGKEEPGVLKLLLLAALVSFFVVGTAVVGFPFLVRNILGLSAEHYGLAESAMGIAAIIGSVCVGLLAKKIKIQKLYLMLAWLGLCLVPAGIAFVFPIGEFAKYLILVLAFCGVQIAASIFSIFALSAIQERTPPHLIGKVMAYVSTISMCAHPLGQIAYGVLFDGFSRSVYLVLVPTGVLITLIAFLAQRFFARWNNRIIMQSSL